MKKRIIILGTIVLFVVLAWTGVWYFAAAQVRQQVEMLALADGETAPQLTCGDIAISGFPFRFDIQCSDAAILSGDILIELPAVRVSTMIYRLNHILGSALGPARISDAFTGLRQDISWTGIEASIRLESWRIARLSLVGDDLAWTDTLFGNNLIASASHIEAHVLDMPERHDTEAARAALAVFARAADIAAPGIELAPTNAEIEAEITGLKDDIRDWGLAPFLPDWQQAGGVLRLVGVRASDGASDVSADGELKLDASGYLTGSISIDSLGLAERIGPFIEEPWRTLVLGTPAENGRHRNQLNFAGGGMSSGLVPITAIPSLF